MPSFSTFTLTALAAASSAKATYTLTDSFQGSTFFDTFDFFTDTDPTAGFVDYVDSSTAIRDELIGLVNGTDSSSSVYLGADFKSKTTTGRQSVRIMSQQAWTHGLFLADVDAIPSVCSGWPSLWFLNSVGPWPTGGEIDMIEVSSPSPQDPVGNQITLHTDAGCAVTNDSALFSGELLTSDCDVDDPTQATNAGCGILTPLNYTSSAASTSSSGSVNNTQRYTQHLSTAGPNFNAKGGGVYAMLWTSSSLTFWFFPRSLIPTDITSNNPDPTLWNATLPVAEFKGCDFDAHIANLSVVINLTFCGSWANETYVSGGCAANTGVETCDAFVGETPEAFKDAYWLINSLKMYQESDNSTTAAKRTLAKRDESDGVDAAKTGLQLPDIDLAGRKRSVNESSGVAVCGKTLAAPKALDERAFTSGASISLRAGFETEGAAAWSRGLAIAGVLGAVFFAALI